MSARFWFGALAGAWLAIQSGCCNAPWPCGNTYCGTECGCIYWHEWFSHKPRCCEPCDFCGDFTESSNPYVITGPPYTRFGPLYSDGTRGSAPGAAGQYYPTPAGPPPSGGESPQPGMMDESAPSGEELPGPTTSMPRGGYQRVASGYNMQGYGPVDSPRGSRTLGKPPRTRLFSR
jgi:hypothetical protein